MRVISGRAKGRRLRVPKLAYGKRIRPLTDATREALFNILQPRIEGADFLDLFAGTGSVGIEALSRGARLSIFVEVNKRVVEVLRQNLSTLDLDDRAEVYTLPATRAARILAQKGARFDVIFLGAPYHTALAEETLKELGQRSLLKTDGVVIAEHHRKQELRLIYGDLEQKRQQAYGDTRLSFYE